MLRSALDTVDEESITFSITFLLKINLYMFFALITLSENEKHDIDLLYKDHLVIHF